MSCCELRDKKSFGKIFSAFLTGYLLRILGLMDRTEMIQDSMILKASFISRRHLLFQSEYAFLQKERNKN